MMRMMVGLMGREAFRSISSRVIPMMDSNTMARSSWFHLHTHARANMHTHYFNSIFSMDESCMFVRVFIHARA